MIIFMLDNTRIDSIDSFIMWLKILIKILYMDYRFTNNVLPQARKTETALVEGIFLPFILVDLSINENPFILFCLRVLFSKSIAVYYK